MPSPEDYEHLFTAAKRLRGRARRKLLSRASRENPAMSRAVESMLAGEDAPRAALSKQASEEERAAVEASLSRLQRLSRFLTPTRLAPALMVAVIGGGLWSWNAIEEGLDKLCARFLQAHLGDNLTTLHLYVGDRLRSLRLLVREPRVIENVVALQELQKEGELSSDRLRNDPLQAVLLEELELLQDSDDYRGFWLIEPSGTIVASNSTETIGLRLSDQGLAWLAPAFEGKETFTPRIREGLLADMQTEDPLTLLAGAVQTDHERTPALVIAFDSSAKFSEIFEEEDFWTTFTFDNEARVLTEPGWMDDLRVAELIPEDKPWFMSPIYLRDPGGDLTRGYEIDRALSELPLTYMAQSALGGESGIELEGYRNILGVQVIGAWLWIPEYGVGLATEVDRSKIRVLLRPLFISMGGISLAFISLGVAAFVLSSALRATTRQKNSYQLGQYTLLDKIGEGGMGEVYKARHVMLRRDTAVKILSRTVMSPDNVARFEREVQLTCKLTHPNTIAVYDYGIGDGGVFYYAMELIEGVTLANLLEEDGPQPPSRVVHILKQVCGSLREAHEVGMIHRDIKPANIMLCHRGGCADVVKVLDFGLVADVHARTEKVTSTKAVLRGTPPYIAPERIRDPRRADALTDIYSLGGVAYALLLGCELFEGDSPTARLALALQHEPTWPAHLGASVTADLQRVVMACIAKDPEQRIGSMDELLEALDALDSIPRWTEADARSAWPSA